MKHLVKINFGIQVQMEINYSNTKQLPNKSI